LRAVRFHDYGDASVLHVDDIDTPAICDDQVLVRVVAAATNILDIALRDGRWVRRSPALSRPGRASISPDRRRNRVKGHGFRRRR